jgi:hypothetical protein
MVIPGSVVFTDASATVTIVSKWVGDPTAGAYTFALPDSTRSWCTAESTQIMTDTGATWTGSAKLAETGSQPVTSFDLVSSVYPDQFNFKI